MSYEIELEKLGLKIRFTAEDEKSVFRKVAIFHEMPEHCGECGEGALNFVHRRAQNYDFYELRCGDPRCGYRYTYGETLVGDNLFPHREWKAPYHGEDQGRNYAEEPPPGHHAAGGQQHSHQNHGPATQQVRQQGNRR